MMRFLTLIMALVMVMSLVACGGGSSEETGNEDTANAFLVGGTGPLTGAAAIYGNAAMNGAQIAVDEINAMGGIQFVLKYEDDAHDAEKAVNAYNALKDWGVQLSLGSVTIFIQNISSARGYVALAANNLCQGHPLGALLSSALFGFTTALSYVLQNTAAKQQLLNCIPYIATIVAMAVYNYIMKRKSNALKL